MNDLATQKMLAGAEVFLNQNRFDRAIPLLQEVIGREPDCFDALWMLSNSLRMVERCKEAVACARRLLILRPTYAAAHARLAAMLVSTGENAEAIAAAEEAVRLEPVNADHYWAIVSGSYQVGDYRKSAAAARRALSLRPSHMGLRLHLPMAVAAMGKEAEAVRMVDANLHDWPNSWHTHVTAGWAYWHLGNLDRAAGFFLQALKLNPQFPWQHEGMAYIRYVQGRRAEALQHYRDADNGTLVWGNVLRSLRRLKRQLREFDDRRNAATNVIVDQVHA